MYVTTKELSTFLELVSFPFDSFVVNEICWIQQFCMGLIVSLKFWCHHASAFVCLVLATFSVAIYMYSN